MLITFFVKTKTNWLFYKKNKTIVQKFNYIINKIVKQNFVSHKVQINAIT